MSSQRWLLGALGVLGVAFVWQTQQIKGLTDRVTELEGVDASFVDTRAAGQTTMQAAQKTPRRGSLGPEGTQAYRSDPSQKQELHGDAPHSDGRIAEVVKEQNAEAWEKRHERWSELREEGLRLDLDEFASEEGMSARKADKLYDLLARGAEDRRYLHEAMMDGTMSIQDVRADMDADREATKTEIIGLIGQEAYSRAEEAGLIRSRRGHHWR